MTLQELLEHAHLDSLGQLDEQEQAAFEAAFAAAAPAVKEQIRQEQMRWAPMENLLPQVEPPAELRDRVLDAVSAAMLAQQAGEFSPAGGQRVSRFWRAGSIGLMSAVVVLASALVYVYQTSRESQDALQTGLLADSTLSVFQGKMRDAVISRDTKRTFFANAAGVAIEGGAAIWSHPSWTQDRLFVDLPQNKSGEEYRLVIMNGGQIDKVLRSFTSNGILQALIVDKQAVGTQFALVSVGIGKAADTGTVLMLATKA